MQRIVTVVFPRLLTPPKTSFFLLGPRITEGPEKTPASETPRLRGRGRIS